MGISPKVSVVKPTGETWEVNGLYVADASVFPTTSGIQQRRKKQKLHLTFIAFVGVNPMVTIMATCLHIAEHVVESLTGPQSSKL